jgi:formylglycine-generating enzyme required for sulfatase activity
MRAQIKLVAVPMLLLAAACGASPAAPEGAPPGGPQPGAAATPADAAGPGAAATPKPADPAAPGASTAPAASGANAAPAAPARPSNGCPDGMARVPGGSFVMGPLKVQAKVDDFCMDITETTAEQFAACVKAGKCTDSWANCAQEASTYGVAGKEKHPMVCVDFPQAEAYCKAQNKRLPREEEWEWAARGGGEARPFPWGTAEPKDQACWSGGGTVRKVSCEVGSFPAGASPQGILDLAGNVFEWTTSANDGKGKMRVARGGSWRDGTPQLMKTARPGGFEVTYRCGFLGIRCVTEPQAQASK